FWLYKPDSYFEADWRRHEGAGPIFINLTHDIDLIRHLCGEIRCVEARQSSAARGYDIEDTAVLLLEFENGALGTVTVSDATVAPWSWEFSSGENPAYPKTEVPAYQIGGTRGALSIPDLRLWSQPEERSWWAPIDSEELACEPRDPFEVQLGHFEDVIIGKVKPSVTGADGLRSLAVVEAIKKAAVERRAVEPEAI
ncbi:MAG: Gfo/Idh/MocA family oxidoreductase, partial [Pseudomonadota bacterium]